MNWVVRAYAAVALGAIPAVLCGCHHTANSWAEVGRDGVVKGLVGVAPPARAGSPARLVVEYRDVGASTPAVPFHVTVPLGDDGLPAYPFRYGGDERHVASIAAELPPQQVRAVESAKLAALGGRRGRRAGAGMEKLHYRSVGMPVEGSDLYAMVYSRQEMPAASPPAPTPDPAEMRARISAFREARLRLLPGEYLVLLPYRQPRPRGQAGAAAARALLATPLTLGMDALELALAPLWLLVR